MGGIITQPRDSRKDGKAVCALVHKVGRSVLGSFKLVDIPLTMEDMPLLPFGQVQKLLLLCVKSWDHIARTHVNAVYLTALFQIYVLDSLRNCQTEAARMIEDALSNCHQKKLLNPTTYMMRYCESYSLGREHARIRVEAKFTMQFCEVLLTAFAAFLDEKAAVETIMYAWLLISNISLPI
jgi:hypothetical protein